MKIEKFMKNCKKVLIKEKFQQMIYKLRDMATNIMNLPDVCLINIFIYFESKEQFKYNLVCKSFSKNLMVPQLRKEIHINNNTTIFEKQVQKEYFKNLVLTSSKLRILSLKFVSHLNNANKDILNIINMSCNPFTLEELYLDGCEGINDEAFDCLMLTEAEIEIEEMYNKQFLHIENQPEEEEKSLEQPILTRSGEEEKAPEAKQKIIESVPKTLPNLVHNIYQD
jgi:hypothetical protein